MLESFAKTHSHVRSRDGSPLPQPAMKPALTFTPSLVDHGEGLPPSSRPWLTLETMYAADRTTATATIARSLAPGPSLTGVGVTGARGGGDTPAEPTMRPEKLLSLWAGAAAAAAADAR